jgi:hypothetical protein
MKRENLKAIKSAGKMQVVRRPEGKVEPIALRAKRPLKRRFLKSPALAAQRVRTQIDDVTDRVLENPRLAKIREVAELEDSTPAGSETVAEDPKERRLRLAKEGITELHEAADATDSLAAFILEVEPKPGSLSKRLEELFGVEGGSFARQLFFNASLSMGLPDKSTYLLIIETVASLKPKGGAEAMLASQIVGVHLAAMNALHKAATAGSDEGKESWTNRATRLLRLSLQQAELYARLQGKITTTTQKFVVERVDVNDGGQAIVGPIATAKGRGTPPGGQREA